MKLDFIKWLKLEGMQKQLRVMLIAVGIVFGTIFLYKGVMSIIMNFALESEKNPVFTVSSAKAAYATWQPQIKAVGSTDSVLGINVTAQLGGMIQAVYLTSGAIVQQGTVLVQQNADPNIALLHSLEANAELAQITYDRDKKQYKAKAVSKQQLDSDLQNLKSLRAQVAQQAATVDQLTIKAPFTGRLGISNVNPGQYLNPGDAIVTLQSLDPIYVNFYLPQQMLSQIKMDQAVMVNIDTYPGKSFHGKITTINPIVDQNTRNVEIQATLPNPENEILPGMFTHVEVTVERDEKFLTLPQTAVSFNPYGEIIYLIKEEGKDKKGNRILTVTQMFVTTGESRGDQISVLTGVKAGDEVVTSGQLKLKNGSHIAINNSVQPSNNPNPVAPNEHQG